MKVYYNINEIIFDKNRVVTIGGFDGIHLGHQKILNAITTNATGQNLKKLVITFNPLPKHFLQNSNQSVLTSIEEKLKIFNKIGIDEVLIMDFNKELSKLSANTFFELLLNKVGFKFYIVGENHTFGCNGTGNLELLHTIKKKFNDNYEVIGINSHKENNIVVSTSLIKKLILTENIEKINSLLGYPYLLIGEVIEGNKIGRQLGFPTANINIIKNKIIPKKGVYLVQVEFQKESRSIINPINIISTEDKNFNNYYGIANIGNRPTINNQNNLYQEHLEVHIFDFDNIIYGMKLNIKFMQYIRNEIKFKDTNELKEQISKDIAFCRRHCYC